MYLDRIAAETSHDPVINRITSGIRKKNIWENYSVVKRPYKDIRHKLTMEHVVICNGDQIITPETQRTLMIKRVHDDIHCGVATTQKTNKITSMVARIFRRMSKNI